MDIVTQHIQGEIPVTILSTRGDVDASNYQELIANAQKLYREGCRRLLLDMAATQYISSSGLVALHVIALLMRGRPLPEPESGWEALHAIDRDRMSGRQESFKLLNLQPRVSRTLESTGMMDFFEIHTDLQEALASFKI